MRNARLISLLKYQCNLSVTEACAIISSKRSGSEYSSEAANHYGGNTRCLKDAIKARHRVYKNLANGSPREYWTIQKLMERL